MASKTKIYIVMELVTGGELFDKIVRYYSNPQLFTFNIGYHMSCTNASRFLYEHLCNNEPSNIIISGLDYTLFNQITDSYGF